jgi:hypothetical protein
MNYPDFKKFSLYDEHQRVMNKHEIDEALNEAYKKGWDDAFKRFERYNNLVQGRAEHLPEEK